MQSNFILYPGHSEYYEIWGMVKSMDQVNFFFQSWYNWLQAGSSDQPSAGYGFNVCSVADVFAVLLGSVPPVLPSGCWEMVFPLVRLSVPLVCLLRSDPYMHSFGVNSGVYKQRCWSLSPPLSAFSLVFSIPGSPFFGALARNLGLWLPPFDTLPTTLPLSRPKQQEY